MITAIGIFICGAAVGLLISLASEHTILSEKMAEIRALKAERDGLLEIIRTNKNPPVKVEHISAAAAPNMARWVKLIKGDPQ
jgi:uncharacterized membrane protein (DUF106 family)